MLTVAMETPTKKVKLPFCIIFDIFRLSPKLQIKISIPQHARTNTKLLLSVKPHLLLIDEKFCVGPWMVWYLNNLTEQNRNFIQLKLRSCTGSVRAHNTNRQYQRKIFTRNAQQKLFRRTTYNAIRMLTCS